jgi:hypothetical protein
MRLPVLLIPLAAGLCVAAAPPAVPTMTEVKADPIAAFQGVWESRFCSKSFQWKVEGNVVTMFRKEASKPATDYDNRYAEGAVIMYLDDIRDEGDRMVRFDATIVDPDSGYRSKGNAAAMVMYENQGRPYLSFNEMIRVDEKKRQCD